MVDLDSLSGGGGVCLCVCVAGRGGLQDDGHGGIVLVLVAVHSIVR